MKIIDRDFKNFKKEAEVEIELLSAMGYDAEDVFQISQHMIKHIEPIVMKLREKQDRIKLMLNK